MTNKDDCLKYIEGMYGVNKIPKDTLAGIVDIVWNTAQEAVFQEERKKRRALIEMTNNFLQDYQLVK